MNSVRGLVWLHPHVLWLLPLLLPLGWLGWKARRRVPRMLHPGLPAGFRPRGSARRHLSSLPLWLRVAAVGLILAALSRPVTRLPWSEDTVNGVDIVLMIDVSTSMQIHDVKPSRIEAARQILSEFAMSRDRDRMGLIAFAAQPVTRCPLTTDREVLRDLIDSTSNQGMEDGTAIGDALLMAGNRLRSSPAKSKVVVLLTDGESNMGAVDPISAARALAALGIRIYTIGLGTEGTFVQDFKLPDGSVQHGQVQSDMNAKDLSEIARISGGHFWRALDRDALENAYKSIDRLERTKISTKVHWETREQFRLLAELALILSLAAWILETTWLRRTP